VRDFIYQKTDVTTFNGKTCRDISQRKEKFALGWEGLESADADALSTIVNLNVPVDFEVNSQDLVIESRRVWANIASKEYGMLGSDYRVNLVLELIDEVAT
jgi:hypothetical protein